MPASLSPIPMVEPRRSMHGPPSDRTLFLSFGTQACQGEKTPYIQSGSICEPGFIAKRLLRLPFQLLTPPTLASNAWEYREK